MKNIFKIYKGDVKRIFSNYAALIVVAALCILPSLYAWFNIAASWDPYAESATSGIKIGVVNNDKGTTLRENEINIGGTVIEELKDNKTLGWQFMTEEEATKGVEEGKLYAKITIPENFSKDLTSILDEDIKKGEIVYTVNEKINAIAPKLTDKGATGVQEKVSKAVVETVSDAIFGVANDLGIELENQIPRISNIHTSLVDIQGKFDSINNTVDLAYDGAVKLEDLIKDIQEQIPLIEKTIQNAQGLSVSVEEFLVDSKEAINTLAPTLKQDIAIINEISNEIVKYTDALIEAINSGSDKVPEMIDNLIVKVSSLQDITESLINILEKLNKLNPARPLDGLIEDLKNVNNSLTTALESLNIIKDNVANGINPDLSLLNKVKEVAESASETTERIYNAFDSAIMPKINEIFDKGYETAEGALAILKEAENKLPRVEEILGIAANTIDSGIDGLDYAKEMLPKAEEMINEVTDKISKIDNNDDLQEVINLLKADVAKRSDFLSNPVNIVEDKLFAMGNYGSAMTPFYSVLSLWVGILLMVSVLSVNAHGEYKSTELYFGKLLLFLTISCIQSLIVALGDLYILKIYCLNPGVFILGCIFTGVVFTFIVYSAVSICGNVGKVIGIILLVLQVAGSGGTFPIELTPGFFHKIYPFLPFTYANSFAREAIGGIVPSILYKDIVILLIWAVISMVLAIVLKKPINKLLTYFDESLNKSEITGH